MTVPAIETVCFDLDDTLVTYNQDPEDVIVTAFDAVAIEQFCDSEELWSAAAGVDDADSDIQFLTKTFRRAAERHGGPTGAAPALANAYDDAIDHADVSFRPGAAAALERARDHAHVGLITNGERTTQKVKLDAVGIHDAFETHVYAGEATPPKPAREPFDRAVAALDATPDRTLYVGNSLQHDVAGARAAGLHAAWFPTDDNDSDHAGHDPDFTFETLHDLADVL